MFKGLVKERLSLYPAVALVGARQAGKTTLAKSFENAFYFDMEKTEDRLKLDLSWKEIIRQNRLIILDEAQMYPELFPMLRAAIDERRKKMNRFLLLGSVSVSLMKEVSESLAGRLGICELTPFVMTEIPKSKRDLFWLVGGYPDGGILNRKRFPVWENDYLNLIAQRDLPNLGLSAKPGLLQRLFKMLALRHGQEWNASELGKSLGLSYHTINDYVEYLQYVYLVRFLQPFHKNFGKRLVKSPKFYWRNTGLLHALLGISTYEQLFSYPAVGNSFEGMVIEQILSYLNLYELSYEAYFLRTSDQYEIDLVLNMKNDLWAIEIKLTSSPRDSDFRRLDVSADMIKASKRIIISRTDKTFEAGNRISTHLAGFLKLLKFEL